MVSYQPKRKSLCQYFRSSHHSALTRPPNYSRQVNEVDADGDHIIDDGGQKLNGTRVQALMKFMSEALGSTSFKSKLDSARSANDSSSDQVLAFLMMQILELSQYKPEVAGAEHLPDAHGIALKVAKLVSLEFFAPAVLPKLQDPDSKVRDYYSTLIEAYWDHTLIPPTLKLLPVGILHLRYSTGSSVMCESFPTS